MSDMPEQDFKETVLLKLNDIGGKVDGVKADVAKLDRTIHGEEGTRNRGIVKPQEELEERVGELEDKAMVYETEKKTQRRILAAATTGSGFLGAIAAWCMKHLTGH